MKNRYLFLAAVPIALSVAFLAAPALVTPAAAARPSAPPAASAGAPVAAQDKVITNVTSEKMVYDSTARKVTFTGQVKVTHPDFTLTSDRLDLFLNEAEGARPQNGGDGLDPGALQRIVAQSRVHIDLPEGRTATCNKATYDVDKETMTMEGNPVLREGPNQVRGDRMIFYLRENRNEVQGRVAVDFISGGESPVGPNGGAGLPGGRQP